MRITRDLLLSSFAVSFLLLLRAGHDSLGAPTTTTTTTQDPRCAWGAGFWCSGVAAAETCHDVVKTCGTLPASVQAANNTERFANWMGVWQGLRKRVVSEDRSRRNRTGSRTLMVVGDSITEALSGHSIGRWHSTYFAKPFPRAKEQFWSQYNITLLPYGIGGDRTEQLLWRLTRGEFDGIAEPDAVLLLIGTNNIGTEQSVDDTYEGIKAVVDVLRGMFAAPLVVMSLLPRADCRRLKSQGVPCERFKLPHPTNTKVADVNALTQRHVQSIGVAYVDCFSQIVRSSPGQLSAKHFPDQLHPSLQVCPREEREEREGNCAPCPT